MTALRKTPVALPPAAAPYAIRSPYVPRGNRTVGGIKLICIWSPRLKGLEAFLHTFMGLLRAAW